MTLTPAPYEGRQAAAAPFQISKSSNLSGKSAVWARQTNRFWGYLSAATPIDWRSRHVIDMAGAAGPTTMKSAALAITVLWRKLVPAINLQDCSQGGLAVTNLDTKAGVSVTLRGVGYTRRDGHTQVWRGLSWLHENLVGSALLAEPACHKMGAPLSLLRQAFKRTAWRRPRACAAPASARCPPAICWHDAKRGSAAGHRRAWSRA